MVLVFSISNFFTYKKRFWKKKVFPIYVRSYFFFIVFLCNKKFLNRKIITHFCYISLKMEDTPLIWMFDIINWLNLKMSSMIWRKKIERENRISGAECARIYDQKLVKMSWRIDFHSTLFSRQLFWWIEFEVMRFE